ncbi:hypothetical protein MPTK1_7g07510 [Marchantia polymorpha subsp. ruderalis]|uniref:Uncharacterized protein n=2 Tax=Marchantia polymorpha TaxID=3197 RepID=A0AAF6BX45_MARPO|nr:hypothetical protein MARPO_0076s0043 [Marchantia polymorpha]BBN16579.1 hypothetical protein Mp_7g07510 [Marchantia polymorpha subsp. ruderalis]|eukprot:PTQ34799.1 hypothetical protein MARPO_0076s0043 [Marchantia polymorpha]
MLSLASLIRKKTSPYRQSYGCLPSLVEWRGWDRRRESGRRDERWFRPWDRSLLLLCSPLVIVSATCTRFPVVGYENELMSETLSQLDTDKL